MRLDPNCSSINTCDAVPKPTPEKSLNYRAMHTTACSQQLYCNVVKKEEVQLTPACRKYTTSMNMIRDYQDAFKQIMDRNTG